MPKHEIKSILSYPSIYYSPIESNGFEIGGFARYSPPLYRCTHPGISCALSYPYLPNTTDHSSLKFNNKRKIKIHQIYIWHLWIGPKLQQNLFLSHIQNPVDKKTLISPPLLPPFRAQVCLFPSPYLRTWVGPCDVWLNLLAGVVEPLLCFIAT